MAKKYDAIIVGGGHNGLVCAGYLAQAGKKVLVLESRHVLGGAAVTEELYPGFKFSVYSYVVSLFRPHIIRELGLANHGLEIIPLEASFLPLPDGDSLCRWSDPELTRREIARFSAKDAEVYPEFGMMMKKMAFFAKNIIDNPAPEPMSMKPGELLNLLGLGKRMRALGEDGAYLHTKMLTMSAVDFLDLWFESDVLKAPMSVSGIIGTFLGVRSPGTAYVLLHHYMGEIDGAFRAWGFAKGGTGGLSLSIASSAESFGAEIRTEAPVQKFLVKNGACSGVVLDNGDEITASHVFSSVDPRRTFLGMVGSEHLDEAFVEDIKRFKLRGSSGKVNLA
ncbi:MAG: NAD(P)/FAD-dependent oxidoreductase, partial [Candidatus Krumholzibacteria bacterium]|nr:NAD(P)/FAD-dependent oxidoreductase [Candidatus Krumholzibacteria bacterium]